MACNKVTSVFFFNYPSYFSAKLVNKFYPPKRKNAFFLKKNYSPNQSKKKITKKEFNIDF